MNNQLKKGILELAILGFLKQKELHGYAIIQELEKFLKVKESSVYIILTRLTQNKYLDSRQDKNGSRVVKIYFLTDEGEQYLKELQDEWEKIEKLISASN